MLALDYLLYDNRTWTTGIGRDWGIKNATGALASRNDLMASFTRYCGFLTGDRGYLRSFGHAMGGVRPGSGKGYLLCVSVETPDPFGRPSWAAYGLWCPDAATLEAALLADTTGAVQLAMRSTAQPPAIVLRPSGSPPEPRRLTTKAPVFRLFQQRTSISEVRALLRGAVRQKVELPNILGITASSQVSALGQEFDVVYCHPLDEDARHAIQEHGTAADELFEPVSDTSVSPARSPRARRGVRRTIWIAALLLVIACPFVPHSPHLGTWTRRSGPAESREALVREISRHVVEIRSLNPKDLDDLARGQGSDVRKACADLTAQWKAISAQPAPPYRPTTGTRACLALQAAYPADFENPAFAARRWCGAFERLERASKALRERDAKSPQARTKSS